VDGPSRIRFRIAQEELGLGLVYTVTPFVDGVSLVELARGQEVRPARATKEPDLAGRYAGLVIGPDPAASDWRPWYLGRGLSWFQDGDTCLLGCVCGDTGCWRLTARVDIGRATVTWHRFRTGHRDWDLGGLGPFVFARSHYERALAEPERADPAG
jgi:hypothetical protein